MENNPSDRQSLANARKFPSMAEQTWKKMMENAGVVAMRKRGPIVSRAGRIPRPEDQSPDLTVVVVVVVLSSILTPAMMSSLYSINTSNSNQYQCMIPIVPIASTVVLDSNKSWWIFRFHSSR